MNTAGNIGSSPILLIKRFSLPYFWHSHFGLGFLFCGAKQKVRNSFFRNVCGVIVARCSMSKVGSIPTNRRFFYYNTMVVYRIRFRKDLVQIQTYISTFLRGVAQSGFRARGLGPWGRWFKSTHPDHFWIKLSNTKRRISPTTNVSKGIDNISNVKPDGLQFKLDSEAIRRDYRFFARYSCGRSSVGRAPDFRRKL